MAVPSWTQHGGFSRTAPKCFALLSPIVFFQLQLHDLLKPSFILHSLHWPSLQPAHHWDMYRLPVLSALKAFFVPGLEWICFLNCSFAFSFSHWGGGHCRDFAQGNPHSTILSSLNDGNPRPVPDCGPRGGTQGLGAVGMRPQLPRTAAAFPGEAPVHLGALTSSQDSKAELHWTSKSPESAQCYRSTGQPREGDKQTDRQALFPNPSAGGQLKKTPTCKSQR